MSFAKPVNVGNRKVTQASHFPCLGSRQPLVDTLPEEWTREKVKYGGSKAQFIMVAAQREACESDADSKASESPLAITPFSSFSSSDPQDWKEQLSRFRHHADHAAATVSSPSK